MLTEPVSTLSRGTPPRPPLSPALSVIVQGLQQKPRLTLMSGPAFHTWKTCLHLGRWAAAAPALQCHVLGQPRAFPGPRLGWDPHCSELPSGQAQHSPPAALLGLLTHGCVHRGCALHWLQIRHWPNPTWASQIHKLSKHQGCLPLTRISVSSGYRCGKRLLLTALGLMEKKIATTVSVSPSRAFLGPHTCHRDLITTWGN